MAAGACELSASAAAALAALDQAGLTRTLRSVVRCGPAQVAVDGQPVVSFASCDYLGLASHPRLAEAAARAAREQGTSTGSARLLAGHDPGIAALEGELAAFFGSPAALVFGSGYLANLGLVTGLARKGDTILSDQLVHASTVDACRLSGADVTVLPHDDPAALERALLHHNGSGRVLVLVEGVYSMDGNVASLAELQRMCARHGAHLLVDDAHGLGVVGPGGRGAAASAGVEPAAQVGNLGKALGSYGAFVLLDEPLRELLLQTARSFVFTCALPPPVVAAAREALAVLADEPWRVPAAQERAATLAQCLADAGVQVACAASVRAGHARSPILPVVIGDGARALAVSARLLQRGWLVPAVRPPTVPPGGERLRITVSAEHTDEQCRALATQIAEALS